MWHTIIAEAAGQQGTAGPIRFCIAVWIGIAALVATWLVSAIITGHWNPWHLVIGADKRPSTSKLQFLLWTAAVIFAYTSLYAIRANAPSFSATNDLPRNVLLAMGISVATMAGAKGITVSYVTSGKIAKPDTPTTAGSVAPVLQDDDGFPDLTKIQMLVWTLIAIAIFLVNTLSWLKSPGAHLQNNQFALPDIDAALMVLMGLSHGAYLGKKVVTVDTPRVTGVSAVTSATGATVTLVGTDLGPQQGGSVVTIDGVQINPVIAAADWSDTRITFKLPDPLPNGKAVPKPDGATIIVQVGVIVGGQSSNNLPLKLP